MGGAGGDQDTENTELMAIYTRENQSAEKVTQAGKYKKKTHNHYDFYRSASRAPNFHSKHLCHETAVN